MPSTTTGSEAGADIELLSSGQHRFHHDDSGNNSTAEHRGDARVGASKALAHMASSNKNRSVSQPDANADLSDANESSVSRTTRTTQPPDGLLQVPRSGNRTSSRPVETSIWDWDTPLESVGDSSSSYYYEPQGELLQEQREQRSSRGEYSVAQPVSAPGVDWPFSESSSTGNNDVFAIPRRPPNNAPNTTAGSKRKLTGEVLPPGSKKAEKRSTRNMSESGDDLTSPVEGTSATPSTRSQAGGPTTRSRSVAGPQRDQQGTTRTSSTPSGSTAQRRHADTGMPMVLPARKVFPIQIGDKLFRLSGASISSDAPSYISQFFEEQLRQNEGADSVRTLYIDRDPATFADISLHLQGYHVEPRDGPHFVKLFADAQFFSLPRLTAQLFSSTIYIRIGDEEFQIPRDLFSNPGDSPNYFSLGFSTFFTSPNEVFPGLSERSLLRPPSILPPSVPNKSAKTFADLLHILKGYPVEVRSEEHRQELLRDARYFHLKGLEQKLIPHQISYNLAREKTEIVIRLEDLRQSGISFVGDHTTTTTMEAVSPTSSSTSNASGPGWIYYQRPYVDAEAYSLIIEIAGEEHTFLSVDAPASSSKARLCRATFYKQTLSRVTSLFSVVASKMNLPITQPLGLMMLERGAGVASLPVSPRNTGMSEERVKCRIGPDADVIVDGRRWSPGEEVDPEDDDDGEDNDGSSAMDVDASRDPSARSGTKRRRPASDDEEEDTEEWIVRKGQWRLRVQPVGGGGGGTQSGRQGVEIILGAVKIEAFSRERSRNEARGFLA